MQEACRKKQGTHGYIETDWTSSESEASQAFSRISASHYNEGNEFPVQQNHLNGSSETESTLRAGHCRMNMSSSSHLGRPVSQLGTHLLMTLNSDVQKAKSPHEPYEGDTS